MTPTPIHHADVERSPFPRQVRRIPWRTALPWGLLTLSLLISLSLGMWVQRFRAQQQYTRGMAANVFWTQLYAMVDRLEHAQQAAAQGDIATTVEALRMADHYAEVTDRSAGMFEVILTHHEQGRSFGISPALRFYGDRASELALTIERQQAILPADQTRLTALLTDITLMHTLFSETLLETAAYDTLATTLTTFCQQMQLEEVKQWIRPMDAQSRAACDSPKPWEK